MNKSPTIKDWISAFRLRTLPLALSCILVGSAIAFQEGHFVRSVFILALTTTLFLQILSNLANDLGDAEKGTDNENRVGPDRAIQSGKITKEQMKKAVALFVVLSLASGVSLIYVGNLGENVLAQLGFIVLGIACIIAAIKYTAGKSAYGYKGLGDLFVFIFFGLVGVCGSFYLYNKNLEIKHILPAMSIGLFSAAVLNLNNMRDHENDKASGKFTMAVKLGIKKAKLYHFTILIIGMLSSLFYVIQSPFIPLNLLFVLSYIPLVIHLITVGKNKSPEDLDPELKKVALSTFLFSILFWISFSF